MSKGVIALLMLMLAWFHGAGAMLAQPPVPLGGELLVMVNTITMTSQQYPSVTSDPDGDFVVAWTSGHTAAPGDIFVQRFDVQPLLDVDGNRGFEPLADGLLILRFGFGFTGASLITGAVGDGCTRCDAPSITAFLQNFL